MSNRLLSRYRLPVRFQSLRRARWGHRGRGDAGMATAEYAVATLAAVAFAGILLAVLTSDTVRQTLTSMVARALTGGA